MQSPLLTILIRIGRNETEPYSKAVREVFLGGGPTGEDPSGTDQLLQCTEIREFVNRAHTDFRCPNSMAVKAVGYSQVGQPKLDYNPKCR
jgi:hypothetical protein